MACLDCVIDLEDVVVCDNSAQVKLPFTASNEGDYTLVLEFGHARLTTTVFHTVGEALEFEPLKINEDFCYFGYVLGPDGLQLMFNVDGKERGKFKFCTKTQITQ